MVYFGDLTQRRAGLRPEQRELLERRIRGEASDGRRSSQIIPRLQHPIDDAPLSFEQERLWVLNQFAQLGAAYHVPFAMRLRGALDRVTLEEAVQQLVERHDSLRACFIQGAERPAQQTKTAVRVELSPEALPGTDASQQQQAISRRISEIVQLPFDLEKGPLIRAVLLSLDTLDHVLVLVIHHIVCDGWSLNILIRDLGELYAARLARRPPLLPELSVTYIDYAHWQRTSYQQQTGEIDLAYWKEQLSGAPPALEIAADRPRPEIQSFRGFTKSFRLSGDLTSALTRFARGERATLFMVLLAGFQVVLSRWSNQQDVVVGTPVAGRLAPELENVVGCFSGMLALRGDLSGDPSFRELVARTRRVALGAFAHQELPFAQLVQELQPTRNLRRQPIFQVQFALQNVPQAELAWPGLEIQHLRSERFAATLDLALYMYETFDGLWGEVEYATDLFEGATVDRLIGHFETFLKAVMSAPEICLSDVEMLTPPERSRLLDKWNGRPATYPHRCIHELFCDQAARTPDAVAVTFGSLELSYGELDRRSNQLANYLRSLGVSAESIVGLCVERSPELIVALLGILKAGGAYLPLDPTYPQERLAHMIGDAGASVVVTQARFPIAVGARIRFVRVDADRVSIDQASGTTPDLAISPDNLAFVLYTSGSTGRPKGVLHTHRVVINRVSLDFETPVDSDVYAHKTTINFPDAAWEIFSPLFRGLPLALIPPQAEKDPLALIRSLSAAKATRVAVVPSLMLMLLETCPDLGQRLPLLRYWSIGGEPLTRTLVDQFQAAVPRARMINCYGTSEFWDGACYDVAEGGEGQWMPIGRPFANMRAYVVDESLQLVPIGVPGELCIAGVGLARGYCGGAGHTAEKFAPSPFDPGERLYRSGDRARWRADGILEFLGRADYQVKIRGNRVDLGEVEVVLLAHPAVRQAAAIVREDIPGDARLIAYVVVTDASSLEEELRQHARRFVPEYMIPTAFIKLDALPLKPNGKIDRDLLPKFDELTPSVTLQVAARTPVEETLANIWLELLRVERVGVFDNFFELGGHSLLATRVLARVRQVLGVDIPLRAMFETPTIAELTELYLTEEWDEGAVAL